MNYSVNIRVHQYKETTLIINEKLAEMLSLTKKKRGYISFGTEKTFVDIIISEEAEIKEILLSESIIESMHIPTYLVFELRVKGNEIAIGPCIGILASRKEEVLSEKRLNDMTINLLDYQRIGGAIIVFSLEKVDTENRLIEGHCYNSKTDSFESGTFPYPQAIYLKTNLSESWENHFLSAIGDKVFNNYSFHKWEMNSWFSKEPDLIQYLPHTVLYKSKESLIDMLQKYSIIYVKPIWGMKGNGVVRVSLEAEKLCFEYPMDEENIKLIPKDDEELEKNLEALFSPEECIIQQGLDLLKYEDGIVDFRCVMQKDETRKWTCRGIFARIGVKYSIVSNISRGGSALPGAELIMKALSLDEVQTFILKEKMIDLCMKACRALDKYGYNFGTLGLDLGVDKDKNVWLIEVNNRQPNNAIALKGNDTLLFYSLLAWPLYYAKSLAGFGDKEDL
ncbi:MAG: YheC/YheD family protein [Clostridiaceae bacterium]|nr:YheC/YheD family protein [Clostridiaceae bacterium]